MSRISASVREQVRQRAQGQCEYCRKPEAFSAHSFQVDHIISQKHKGSDEFDNLAWACFRCNVNKGTDIASVDAETGNLIFLFNPRLHVWQQHFAMNLQTGEFIGISPEGRIAVEILDMNHLDQIEARKILIDAGIWDS